MSRYCFIITIIFGVLACSKTEDQLIQIAFLADVHLTNIYGELSDTDFKGLQVDSSGEYVFIRSMGAQLRSTRIFNENYFAFVAALDEITQRGIKIVAFPGDYTDDGQPINIRGLREILDRYEEKYGIQFLITTGNHDPVRPFLQDAGKPDFLGEEGKNQPIFSSPDQYKIDPSRDHQIIVSQDVAELGYEGIISELGNFGYLAQKDYVFWSTPFSNYEPETYTFEKAIESSILSNRVYEVAEGITIPDATYLVEPVDGLWLVAIDGNVYIPKDSSTSSSNPHNYGSPGVGYNNFSDNKDYFMEWLSKIVEQAEELNKTLIAFSHYPAIDFNDDASPILGELLGDTKWQLERVPGEQIAKDFANAGLRIHVAGHMHINDTGFRVFGDNSLINIQTPSLAAYRPGFKILTIINGEQIMVETITIDSVPNFNQLFSFYEMEYSFLESVNEELIWNREILNSQSYHEYMLGHLEELVRLRFIYDWPEQIRSKFLHEQIQDFSKTKNLGLIQHIGETSAYEMLLDLYKIRNADVLAFKDIPSERIEVYQILFDEWKTIEPSTQLELQIKQFFQILNAFLNGEPADVFFIDLRNPQMVLTENPLTRFQ
jgi:hypothetical protein